MEIDVQKLRQNIIERANLGATKAHAPELYHAIGLLLAYIENDYSQVEVNSETGWYTLKS
jgi:hypothetical protein